MPPTNPTATGNSWMISSRKHGSIILGALQDTTLAPPTTTLKMLITFLRCTLPYTHRLTTHYRISISSAKDSTKMVQYAVKTSCSLRPNSCGSNGKKRRGQLLPNGPRTYANSKCAAGKDCSSIEYHQCREFQAGLCSYGDKCKYSHTEGLTNHSWMNSK